MHHRLLVSLVVLAVAVPAAACTCTELPSPPEAFAQADGVFEARVDFQRAVGFDLEVEFVVQRSWKGVRTARVILRTFPDEAACGFPFATGGTYLVYASDLAADGLPPAWRTSLCTRTKPIGDAGEDLAFLSGRTIVSGEAADWSTTKALYHR